MFYPAPFYGSTDTSAAGASSACRTTIATTFRSSLLGQIEAPSGTDGQPYKEIMTLFHNASRELVSLKQTMTKLTDKDNSEINSSIVEKDAIHNMLLYMFAMRGSKAVS